MVSVSAGWADRWMGSPHAGGSERPRGGWSWPRPSSEGCSPVARRLRRIPRRRRPRLCPLATLDCRCHRAWRERQCACYCDDCRPAPEHVRIGYPATSTSFLTIFVAQEQGFYARQAIDAELMLASAQVSITGLTTGDMEFTMSLGSAARAAAQGLPVRVVEQSGTAPQLYVLGQPDLRALADLRGKVLSPNSISGTTGQTAILLLRKHGVGRDEVQLIPGGDAPRQMEMLRQRQIDAALLPPPFPFLARREGFTLLASAPDELQLAFSGLSTSQDTIARRGEMVRRTIVAELEALQYLRADRASTLRLMADRFAIEPDLAAQTYDLIIGSYSRDGGLPREGGHGPGARQGGRRHPRQCPLRGRGG